MLVRVNWYIQSSLKHITELITGNKSYYRGGRYRQVSLYIILFPVTGSHETRLICNAKTYNLVILYDLRYLAGNI